MFLARDRHGVFGPASLVSLGEEDAIVTWKYCEAPDERIPLLPENFLDASSLNHFEWESLMANVRETYSARVLRFWNSICDTYLRRMCICQQTSAELSEQRLTLVPCEICQHWFHEKCVNVDPGAASFMCADCMSLPANVGPFDFVFANTVVFSWGIVELPPVSADVEVFFLPKGHVAFDSSNGACGLRAKNDLPEGHFIGCYAGVVQSDVGLKCPFAFRNDVDHLVVDAKALGNQLRFLNHSSLHPNVVATLKNQIVHFSTCRSVKKGQELSFHLRELSNLCDE
jgi:hypothetical protein